MLKQQVDQQARQTQLESCPVLDADHDNSHKPFNLLAPASLVDRAVNTEVTEDP